MLKLALTGALALAFTITAQAQTKPAISTTVSAASSARVVALRDAARKWESLTGLPRARTRTTPGTPRSLRFWRRRTRAVERFASNPPHKRGWLCIHHFEGSWQDSGDPYWGGLQMDRGFMRTYAPAVLLRRGWANRWTPLEQMWVAERAHRSGRGYNPWPNTARYCGLL